MTYVTGDPSGIMRERLAKCLPLKQIPNLRLQKYLHQTVQQSLYRSLFMPDQTSMEHYGASYTVKMLNFPN